LIGLIEYYNLRYSHFSLLSMGLNLPVGRHDKLTP